MKILCETQLLNRQTQTNKGPRAIKSTLALGYKPTVGTETRSAKELEIMLFTTKNKVGVRYKVSGNIENVYTKFAADGKATISFKEPPENLLIKCNPIQLKSFLQTLQLGLQGKTSVHLHLNIASATAIPQKHQPQKRMSVLQRSDYPIKGFPKSLEQLVINNTKLQKLSFEICALRNLKVLDIRNNNLSNLPRQLGNLALEELHLAENTLGECKDWSWLCNKTIKQSLRQLDLSSNKLSRLPPELLQLEHVVTLKLNDNQLQRLPFGISRLSTLRYLHVSANQLQSLPASINELPLDMLDIWNNDFESFVEHSDDSVVKSQFSGVTPLWLLGARAVQRLRPLACSNATLPYTLVDFIKEAPKCACGKLCYRANIFERALVANFENVKNLTYSRTHMIYLDIVLCGTTCSGLAAIKAQLQATV